MYLKSLAWYQVHKKHPINGANIILECYIQTMSAIGVLRFGGEEKGEDWNG